MQEDERDYLAREERKAHAGISSIDVATCLTSLTAELARKEQEDAEAMPPPAMMTRAKTASMRSAQLLLRRGSSTRSSRMSTRSVSQSMLPPAEEENTTFDMDSSTMTEVCC